MLEELNISLLFSDNVLEIQFIGDNDSNVEKTNCNLTNMDYIHERKNLAPRRLHEKRQLAKCTVGKNTLFVYNLLAVRNSQIC